VIALKDGDVVVGASVAPDDSQIVLITDAAQLLNFPASSVRPQGPSASGMAGITLAEGSLVIWAGVGDRSSDQVVTLSGSRSVLPGTEALRIKRTPLSEFPQKGRATGGVRAHSFLKGEDILVRAFVGLEPRLLGPTGKPIEFDGEPAKRDASGTSLESSVGFIGEALR
jgi:DNA gyrase subunit A